MFLCTSCLVSTLAYCINSESGNTTCYIFKKDILSKKAACNYISSSYMDAEGVHNSTEFNVKDYGKIEFDALNDLNNKPYLNRKVASLSYRHSKSLKQINKAEVDKLRENSQNMMLMCFKQKKGDLELCHFPIYGD